MDGNTVPPVGVFVIILFLLIGLVVMGCMLYWNWSHRKQRHAEDSDNISSGNACIYEKNNQRPTYNRSTSLIITANAHPYTGSDAENGSIVQKQ